jgi:hypothetical protein
MQQICEISKDRGFITLSRIEENILKFNKRYKTILKDLFVKMQTIFV